MNMNDRQKAGLIGTLIIGVGLFMPSVNILPMMGIKANFLEMHEVPGFIMIGLVLLSAALLLWKQTASLFFVGLASLGTIGYTFVTFNAKMESQLVIGSGSVDWGYGWLVLVIGSAVLLATFGSDAHS